MFSSCTIMKLSRSGHTGVNSCCSMQDSILLAPVDSGALVALWPRGCCGCALYGVECHPDLIIFFKVHLAHAALSQHSLRIAPL